MTQKARQVLWYPTQAKTGLEWGTQPLLTVKQSKKVTASPTASRGRQDDESVGEPEEKQQVPPLRFAPVTRHAGTGGMTNLFKSR